MTKLEDLTIKHARLQGEYIGTLKGILWWDIPEDLKKKIKENIKKLESDKL